MVEKLAGETVLVTGAAGFIGSHLTRRLDALGAAVHVVLRPASRLPEAVPWPEKTVVHRLDLRDKTAVSELIRDVRPERIFNLAAETNVSRDLERLASSLDDLNCVIHLLAATAEHGGCKCFIQAGTCEEYGDNPVPFDEDQRPTAVSAYSAAKIAATHYCLMLQKTLGLPITVVRPFLTYGPGQDFNRFISKAIAAALREEDFPMTAGEQTREFNYVDDIVEGFVLAATSPGAIGEIINLGNGIEYSLRQVVEMISEICGKPLSARFGAIPYREGETWHFYASNQKARRLLGWEPKIDLKPGLQRTIDFYRQTLAPGSISKA